MAQLNPNGSVAGNAQNVPEAHVPRTRSTFLLKRHFFNTHRFGEYIPHFFSDLNKDEDFPINSSHSLRTYTLKAPLMQDVTRNKDYFLVPMEAILPLNWEKFFDNPVRGDDVLDDVGPTVEHFWKKVALLVQALYSSVMNNLNPLGSGVTSEVGLQAFFRFFIIGEYFYSSGNLLASLGCHGNSYVTHSWDDYFDYCLSVFINASGQFGVSYLYQYPDLPFMIIKVDGFEYRVSLSGKQVDQGSYPISLRHALQLMRDNPTFVVYQLINNFSIDFVPLREAVSGTEIDPGSSFPKPALVSQPLAYEVHCNLSRLWAYQLSVAHYMTNDHIDYVYSADLYRQLIGSYLSTWFNTSWGSSAYFTRNGIKYQYDYLSAHFFTAFTSAMLSSSTYINNLLISSTSSYMAYLGYLSALFGYRRSLRYLDYFTGSRAQPLAVVNTSQINTNVSVNNNQVSVIDITKSIQAQRFLNSVNRVRHNFEGYLKGIFGGETPAPDYHNPFKLAHTDDVVFGQETENTATEQFTDKIAITTNLRSHSGNYVFEIHTDRPCVAIGITSYEIARIYTRSMDRSFLYLNRFDWFNPFMQFTGDQPVFKQELGINPNQALFNLSNFAYAIRHEEYKQWFHIASGAFCNPSTDLDNWIFVAKDARGDQSVINPDWIRSLNCEFDNFFVSLTGWSLGTYFHFIVDDFNSCKASRPMAFAPQILG